MEGAIVSQLCWFNRGVQSGFLDFLYCKAHLLQGTRKERPSTCRAENDSGICFHELLSCC